jgi:hypothetical protein
LAVEYLLHLDSEDYIQQFTAHMESLVANLEKGEREMYVSAFEKVYTEKARVEVARNMLNDGVLIDNVVKYTTLPREEVEKLLN